MPLRYLSNFWRSPEMLLINCKIELKLKRKKCCVLPATTANTDNANSNNIISTIKDKKLGVPVVALLAKDK